MVGLLIYLGLSSLALLLALAMNLTLLRRSAAKRRFALVWGVLASVLVPLAALVVLTCSSDDRFGLRTALVEIRNRILPAASPPPTSPEPAATSWEPVAGVPIVVKAVTPLPPVLLSPPARPKRPANQVVLQPSPKKSVDPGGWWRALGIPVLATIWGVGFLLSGLRLVVGICLSQRHLKQCLKITDAGMLELAGRAAKQADLPRVPPLYASPRNISPSVVGAFAPKVILSRNAAQEFTAEELRAVFLHEFSHIRNGDTRLNLLLGTLATLLWFQPLLYPVIRKIRMAQEELCDNDVAQVSNRFEYARLLLKTSQMFPLTIGRGALAMASGTSPVQRRIDWILDEQRDRSSRASGMWRLSSVSVVLLLVVSLGTVAAAIQTPPRQTWTGNLQPFNRLAQSQAGIYYNSAGNEAGLRGMIRMDPDGKNSVQLMGSFPGSFDAMELIPNQERFVVAGRVDGKRQLWVVDETGAGQPLGPDHTPNQIYEIGCSPDGTRVACYVEGHSVGESFLYIYDLNAMTCEALNPVQLVDDALFFRTFSWSPDGSKLAIESVLRIEHHRFADMIGVDRTSAIDILDFNTRSISRLVPPARSLDHPNWSPDGTRLAWRVSDKLLVTPVDDVAAEPQVVLRGLANVNFPCQWSPDSQRILAHRLSSQTAAGVERDNAVLAVEVATGQVTAFPFQRQIWYYAWSPDSDQFALTAEGELQTVSLDGTSTRVATGVGHWSWVRWTDGASSQLPARTPGGAGRRVDDGSTPDASAESAGGGTPQLGIESGLGDLGQRDEPPRPRSPRKPVRQNDAQQLIDSILNEGYSADSYRRLNWQHVEYLMSLIEDETRVSRVPVNPFSSQSQASCEKGVVAMWLIDAICTGNRYPALNPVLSASNLDPAEARIRATRSFQRWWNLVRDWPAEEARRVSPLCFSGVHWYGQRVAAPYRHSVVKALQHFRLANRVVSVSPTGQFCFQVKRRGERDIGCMYKITPEGISPLWEKENLDSVTVFALDSGLLLRVTDFHDPKPGSDIEFLNQREVVSQFEFGDFVEPGTRVRLESIGIGIDRQSGKLSVSVDYDKAGLVSPLVLEFDPATGELTGTTRG